MLRSKLLSAAFVLFLLALLCGRAEACSCGGGQPPCGGQLSYLRASGGAVFTAMVSELKPIYPDADNGSEDRAFPSSYKVRLAARCARG
ncbi:MAG TPA: hypothetical protein VGO96_01465 [Pyrinomonadaceae bacterium]|jgi:hypothetical protein|nr:hypothetical protein [Pyrinomonadaceae bacterium]